MARSEWPVTGTIHSKEKGIHATLIKCDFDGVNDIASHNLSLPNTLLPPGFESKIRKGIAKGLTEACSNGYCPNLSNIDKCIVRNVILKNVSTAAALEARGYIPLPAFQGLYDSYDSLYNKIAPQKIRDKYNVLRVKLTAQLPHTSTSHTNEAEEIISALGLVKVTQENHTATNVAEISERIVTYRKKKKSQDVKDVESEVHAESAACSVQGEAQENSNVVHQQKKMNDGVDDKESEVNDAESATVLNKGEAPRISAGESVLKLRKAGSGFTNTINLKIEHQASVNQMEPMTTADLLNKLASSLRKSLRAQKLPSRSVTISNASLLNSGDVEVVLNSETRKSLRKFEDVKVWNHDFEKSLIALPVQTCKVTMNTVEVGSMIFQNRKEKAAIIRELAAVNRAIGNGSGVEPEIGDIYWAKDYSQKQKGSLIIEFLDAKQANLALLSEIHWQGRRYHCERLEKHLRLRRCSKCQDYGHELRECSGSYRCGTCAGPHHGTSCRSDMVRCASCRGKHRTGSSGCPVKIEARRRLEFSVENKTHEVHPTSTQRAQHSDLAARTQTETSMPLPASPDATAIHNVVPGVNPSVPEAGPSKSAQSELDSL